MWFYIPDETEKSEPWIGKVNLSDEPRKNGSFELIRHVEVSEIYRNPFENQETIVGLLDHQRHATLIGPLVTLRDPGYLGGYIRTRLEGHFQGLLSGFAIRNPKEPKFRGFGFKSAALRSWYGGASHRSREDMKLSIPMASKQEIDEFAISIGTVRCARRPSVSMSTWSTSVEDETSFSITFDELQSLDQISDLCFAFDSLFRFLVGHPGKPAKFHVWCDRNDGADDIGQADEGQLELLGRDWLAVTPPILEDCCHHNGADSITLKDIIEAFLPRKTSILARIHAVEYSRYYSKNIVDKFRFILPALDGYIKSKFKNVEEQEFISRKDDFFAWLDQNEEFSEFAKKHMKFIRDKSPSLKVLIQRAITSLNQRGFAISPSYADRITKRRGKLFHSIPEFLSAQEARGFYDELLVATSLLLFHTLEDLGVDISRSSQRPYAFKDVYRVTMKKPDAAITLF